MYGRTQWYTFAFVFYIISNIVVATANNYNTLVVSQVPYPFVTLVLTFWILSQLLI